MGRVRICVVANPASGRNSRGDAALDAALKVLGPQAEVRRHEPGTRIGDIVARALRDGFDVIVAAGGDGTIVSVAQAMLGQPVPMGILPLGTFNYFARGLGLPQDPAGAADVILTGTAQPQSVGEVNGQVFLNNASIGLYPYILQTREDTYRRFGRSRLMAYWSVVQTFLAVRRPRLRTITVDGQSHTLRTPLIFAARSAYQLKQFGLSGAKAVDRDRIALFVLHETSRAGMFRMAWRLLRGRIRDGQDVDIHFADRVEVTASHPADLVAFDGEKRRMHLPIRFTVRPDALSVMMPRPGP